MVVTSTGRNRHLRHDGLGRDQLGLVLLFDCHYRSDFVLVVALTKVGRVKMGPDHSGPRFNLFTWASMLFAAGIGAST